MSIGNGRFYQVIIGGVTFEGALTAEGPSLVRTGRDHRGTIGIGASAVILPAMKPRAKRAGLHACRYDARQPRVDLVDLSDEDVRRVSAEFGIPVARCVPTDFFATPAGHALVRFAERNPGIASSYARMNSSMGDWLSAARRRRAA